MRGTTCTCDVCGTEKGETNHWHLVTVEPDGFVIQPWEAASLDLSEYEHICGEECLHKRLNAWLESNRT